jgi:pSer/pThr/pTyr-binding forkhead associated (FHA) protein
MYKLLHTVESNVIGEHPLEEGLFRIGRKTGNDMQPDDASVSGNHAVIAVTPSAYMDDMYEVSVEDLGSTNGTYVNGKRIIKQLLKHGDVLTLGTMTLKFIDEQALALGGTRILLTEEEEQSA